VAGGRAGRARIFGYFARGMSSANRLVMRNDYNHKLMVVKDEAGKIGWALAWLIGVPLPVLIILYLIFGH
jgi:hypothetical protein